MKKNNANKYSYVCVHFTKSKAFTLEDKLGLIIIVKRLITIFIYEIRNNLVYERCEVIL